MQALPQLGGHYMLWATIPKPQHDIIALSRLSGFALRGLAMPRRVTSPQIRAKLRQAQSREPEAIQKWNNSVRTYNNRIRQYNSERKRAIDTYNREVRAHNTRVRTNRARLRSALQRLSAQTVTVRYTSLHASVAALSTAYERLDNSDADPLLSDLAERDTANSVTVLNTLLGDNGYPQVADGELTGTRIAESLTRFSTDLNDRWFGAVFALQPGNPDAARHFCTSAREIIADILNIEAPDAEVLARFPDCQVTEQGTPTRRAKVHYCLDRSGVADGALESFIDTNINDLSVLFKGLNAGAHGPAGRFSLPQLTAIKTRVEDAIDFICEIVS